jgi:hypothetical protein
MNIITAMHRSRKMNEIVEDKEDIDGLFIKQKPSLKRSFESSSSSSQSPQSKSLSLRSTKRTCYGDDNDKNLNILPQPKTCKIFNPSKNDDCNNDKDDYDNKKDSDSHITQCMDSIIVKSNKPVPNLITNDQFKENILASTGLGWNMYLDARTVFQYCLYWMSQYSNSTIKSEWWFNELIEGILHNPIRIELLSDLGYPSMGDKIAIQYRHLYTFAGSDMHRLPLRIFVSQKNDALFEALNHLTNPVNKCFLYYNNAGLRGEIHLSLFKYVHILNYFFEPSFIVITCFVIYICHLLYSTIENIIHPPKTMNQTQNKEFIRLRNELYQRYIPNIKRIINAIEVTSSNGNKVEKGEELGDFKPIVFECLNKNNEFHKENDKRLRHDLVQLKNILETYITDNPFDMKLRLLKFWEEKAAYCDKMKLERLKFVLNKYR